MGEDTLLLLGAGASVDAGLPTTAKLTHDVVTGSIRRQAERRKQAADEQDLERARLAERVEQGDPRAQHEWQEWLKAHPNSPIRSVMRTDPLQFVYGRLRAQAARDITKIEPIIDLEDLVTVLDQLTRRAALGISGFVGEWDPELLKVDHCYPSPRWEVAVTNFDSHLVNFIEDIIESRLTVGKGGGFARARKEVLEELPHHLKVSVHDVGYLRPLVEWAQRTRPARIATLNHDRTIETICSQMGAAYDTGTSHWKEDLDLRWQQSADLHLLKLHGSLPGEGWSHFDREPFLFGGEPKLTAVGPYIEMLATFRRWAVRASHVIVIGYSFRDHHINESLSRAFKNREERSLMTTLTIVDPADPEPEGRPPWPPVGLREGNSWPTLTINVRRDTAADYLASKSLG